MTSVLRELIREVLICEGRIDDAIRKYPDLEKEIRQLSDADPSGNQKYVMWMSDRLADILSKWHLQRKPNVERIVNRLIRVAHLFHERGKQLQGLKRDINFWKDDVDLEHQLSLLDSVSSLRKKGKEGGRKIFDDGRFIVIVPETEEAACYYGYGTKWCISGHFKNQYERYVNEGARFYLVIDRNAQPQDPLGKIAFKINISEINIDPHLVWKVFDSKDKNISIDLLKLMSTWGIHGRQIINAISNDVGFSASDIFGEFLVDII